MTNLRNTIKDSALTLVVKLIILISFTLAGCAGSAVPSAPSSCFEAGQHLGQCADPHSLWVGCDAPPAPQCTPGGADGQWCCSTQPATQPTTQPGNYCFATANGCMYQWPIPQSQIDSREIVCPDAAAIVADVTSIAQCSAQ